MSTVNYLISEVTGLPVPFDPLTQTLTFNNLAVAASGVVLEQVGSDTLVTARDSTGITLFTVTLLGVTASSLSGSQFIFEDGSFYKQGTAGNDSLVGDVQSDYLNGLAGRDTMTGGDGDDTYIVDSTSDVVKELVNGGNDTVYVSVNGLGLAANVENLVLTGVANNNASGNALSNVLTGNSGNNILAGVGGSGVGNVDTLIGGDGNDTYMLGSAGDSVQESVDGGIDTVQSTFNITLADNIEKLLLTGSAVIGVGNEGDNTLTGNAVANNLSGSLGNDTLDGAAGVDTLAGGEGNDTYINASGDVVNESAGSEFGTHDVMSSSVSYTLNVANVEDVALTGSSAINATGDAKANTLTGNVAANTLDGTVGAADILQGGLGNDTYIVRNSGDSVVETSSIATEKDTVQSYVNAYTLGNNVENLQLMGTVLSGTGNALANTITGNALDNTLDGGAGIDTLVGGVGNDIYIVDSTTDVITEASGTQNGDHDVVHSSISYTLLAANVEDVTLTGNSANNVTGSTAANVLTGNGANNILTGKSGAAGVKDTMVGGGGDDTYVLGSAADVITEAASTALGGVDLIQSSFTYNLSLATNVENLTLTGTSAINATGDANANILTGNSGANILDSTAGAADILKGGLGNDTYVVRNSGDSVIEESAIPTEKDTVQSYVNAYTLGDNVENLQLMGTVLSGTGNELANTITGNALNNTLAGGVGADTLIGMAGDDIYIVDNAKDIVDESSTAAGGTDEVISTVTYTLSANVENLTLATALPESSAINATGNDGSNTLKGNDAANILDGGAGVDTLQGGSGNDTYIVDSLTDTISDSQGTDIVNSSVTFSLSSSLVTNVENLTLIGTAAIDATGNSVSNILTGNTAANILDGAGGADTLYGGTGNDTYVVDNLSDVVIEESSLFTEKDTVKSTVSYTLGNNLENLTLEGSSSVNGRGNYLNNLVIGNGAANVLNGVTEGASIAGDTLKGGAGNDTYIVNHATDRVMEESTLAGEIDTVQSKVSYTLTDNVENLVLTDSAATGTGNVLTNDITGNSGANILTGSGLSNGNLVDDNKADTLRGGAGADTYIVGAGDVVVETSTVATEIDLVKSALSLSILDVANVENITLTGASAVNAEGNAKANVLTGNSAANELNGQGGNDTMIGGDGNDSYYVNSGKDVVTETNTDANQKDTVYATVNYILGANLEHLVLSGAAKVGTGNTLNNSIMGNDLDNTLDGKGGADTLTGGVGSDTYVAYSLTENIVELEADAGTDLIKTALDNYTMVANVENLTLTGTAKVATGNDLANKITGNTLANTLYGQALVGGLVQDVVADILVGGTGADTYYVGTNDEISETSTLGSEVDKVISSVSWTLGANLEKLELAGSSNINGTGNGLANTITGNSGNNTLDGGDGTDVMAGLAGNDTYIVNSISDVVKESVSDGGSDEIKSSVTFALTNTLTAGVEKLTLTSSLNINATGNNQSNVLTGNSGANVLNGGAGSEIDTLIGGGGNDTYILNSASDIVIEASASSAVGGIDLVKTSVTYDLNLLANVENLTLLAGAVNGSGNALNNIITGNAVNNIIDGRAGADTLIGGSGNDTYMVDNAGDVITETAIPSTTTTVQTEYDTVISTASSYTLRVNIEKLILDDGALNGTGNAGKNVISGNDVANIIDGGAGADSMMGGDGNDTYFVDNTGDLITDTSGVDTVKSYISYVLGSTTQVGTLEKLVLVGTGAVNATGDDNANTLVGNAAANSLTGKLGADTLTGGAGNDKFILTSSVDADLITDFTTGDKLSISKAGIAIGDKDTALESAVVKASAGGFSSANELVIFTADITGGITTDKAAAAIGSSTNVIANGQTRLFAVDNGTNTNVYLFTSNGDAAVSVVELKLLVTMQGVDDSAITDYQFQV